MELKPLLLEMASMGLNDADISRRVSELTSLAIPLSIIHRLRSGKHKSTSWERTNALITVHAAVMNEVRQRLENPPLTLVPVEKKRLPMPKMAVGIDLIPDVDPQIASDYLLQRQDSRRRPFTATALKGLRREADRAGISLEDAMRVCCEQGWNGFKAEWYRRLNERQRYSGPQRFSGAAHVLRNVKI